jgi:hypothetical protein
VTCSVIRPAILNASIGDIADRALIVLTKLVLTKLVLTGLALTRLALTKSDLLKRDLSKPDLPTLVLQRDPSLRTAPIGPCVIAASGGDDSGAPMRQYQPTTFKNQPLWS